MNEENYRKFIIVSNYVSEMFQEAGFKVFQFRNENLLDELAETKIKKDVTASLLFTMPKLIILSKKNEAKLLNVRYVDSTKQGRNLEWGYQQSKRYWPNSITLVATNGDPFFYVVRKDKLVALSKSIFKINKKTSTKYAHLMLKSI